VGQTDERGGGERNSRSQRKDHSVPIHAAGRRSTVKGFLEIDHRCHWLFAVAATGAKAMQYFFVATGGNGEDRSAIDAHPVVETALVSATIFRRAIKVPLTTTRLDAGNDPSEPAPKLCYHRLLVFPNPIASAVPLASAKRSNTELRKGRYRLVFSCRESLS
jgi:hypothetical protein